jgi:hypothetical protein
MRYGASDEEWNNKERFTAAPVYFTLNSKDKTTLLTVDVIHESGSQFNSLSSNGHLLVVAILLFSIRNPSE